MWFAFGLITLIAAMAAHFRWRRQANWSGFAEKDAAGAYDVGPVFGMKRSDGSEPLKRVRVGVRGAPKTLHFDLRPEQACDRWSKWIGLSVEHQLRDPAFDQHVYLESDDAVVAKALEQDAALRARILELFDPRGHEGFRIQRVRCRSERLWIEAVPDRPERRGVDAFAAKRLPLLRALAARLIEAASLHRASRDPFVPRAIALLSVSSGAAVFGTIFVLRAGWGRTDVIEPFSLLALSWVPSLVLLGAFLLLALRLLGRSARAHLVLFELWLVGGYGFLSGGYALAREANIAFDSAPPQVHQLEEARATYEVHRGKGGRRYYSYHLETPRWPAGIDGPSRIDIDRATFERLESAERAQLMIHPGALGVPWVGEVGP